MFISRECIFSCFDILTSCEGENIVPKTNTQHLKGHLLIDRTIAFAS